ncbi:MAG: hypothetical protein ABR567_17915 [Myxococcales bacterium]|nr:hypothetical protein [Myxococcales bacterium]
MPKPVLALVMYQARPGSEEELAGVLRTHVARLRELGLVADRPHFVAARTDQNGAFVESFWWAHEGAPALAHDHSEVQEIWMRVEDLCVSGGVKHVQLSPLD